MARRIRARSGSAAAASRVSVSSRSRGSSKQLPRAELSKVTLATRPPCSSVTMIGMGEIIHAGRYEIADHGKSNVAIHSDIGQTVDLIPAGRYFVASVTGQGLCDT
ncbi:hypothetical protein GCM10023085_23130 [Actinomadura viridis]